MPNDEVRAAIERARLAGPIIAPSIFPGPLVIQMEGLSKILYALAKDAVRALARK